MKERSNSDNNLKQGKEEPKTKQTNQTEQKKKLQVFIARTLQIFVLFCFDISVSYFFCMFYMYGHIILFHILLQQQSHDCCDNRKEVDKVGGSPTGFSWTV